MATETRITDNFFASTEMPIKLTTADLTEIRRQGTVGAKVRITSNIQGTGHILPTAQGLSFDLPQTTLEFNGVRHTCYGCLLAIPAMHAYDISGFTYKSRKGSEMVDVNIPTIRNSDAELHLYFMGDTTTTNSSQYTLVFPIRIGKEGIGVEFFASLGQLQRTRPTFGSLLTEDTPLVLYKGVSLEGCLKDTCTNTTVKSYLLALKPLVLRGSDFARFTAFLTSSKVYDASKLPISAISIRDSKRTLISYIERILVTAPQTGQRYIQNGYVETEQVKCRPLDMTRDISGNKVYVGGPGQYTSLKKELEDAADLSKSLQDPDASTDVSTVETILAVVVAILIAILIIGIILWMLQKKEGGYAQSIALKTKLGMSMPSVSIPNVKDMICGAKNLHT